MIAQAKIDVAVKMWWRKKSSLFDSLFQFFNFLFFYPSTLFQLTYPLAVARQSISLQILLGAVRDGSIGDRGLNWVFCQLVFLLEDNCSS